MPHKKGHKLKLPDKPSEGPPTLKDFQEAFKGIIPEGNRVGGDGGGKPDIDNTPLPEGTVFTDPETGVQRGIVVGGKTRFGLNREEVNLLLQQEKARLGDPGVIASEKQKQTAEFGALTQGTTEEEQLPAQTQQPVIAQQLGETTGFLDSAFAGALGFGEQSLAAEAERKGGTLQAGTLPIGPGAAVRTAALGNSIKAVKASGTLKAAANIGGKLKGLGVGLLAAVGAATAGIGALRFAGVDLDPERANAYQQAANTLGEFVSDIETAMSDGRLTPDDGEARLDTLREGIAFYEQKLQLNTRENRKNVRSGDAFDIFTDINEKKKIIALARGEAEKIRLTKEFPLVDEQLITDWVSKMSSSELDVLEKEYNRQIKALERGEVPGGN